MNKISLILLITLHTFIISCSGQSNSPYIYIQPYLQNVTQKSITILWWTNYFLKSNYIFYTTSDSYLKKEASTKLIKVTGKFLHEVTITKLKPQTSYKYYIQSDSLKSRKYNFQTAVKPENNFHFVVFGDGRTDENKVISNHRTITKLAWEQQPDIAFHLGDFVYSGNQKHWDRFWRRIATTSDPIDPGLAFASSIPYYLVVGNHEIYDIHTEYNLGNTQTTMTRFKAYVSNPDNYSKNPLWKERYYSLKYGVAMFIILDTNNTSNDNLDNHKYLVDGSTPDWEPGSEQYTWLEKQLKKANNKSVFTFVMMHPAPYSRGTHGAPEEDQSGWHLRLLDPLFRKYGVDAVFCSHDHLVERCLTGPPDYEKYFDDKSTNNLNYFVMGNSGQSARLAAKKWQTWMDIHNNNSAPFYTRYFYDWAGLDHFSFLDVDIKNLNNGKWEAMFQVIRDDGKYFDRFSIIREVADEP